MYSCKLNNGITIPCIGLGMWRLSDKNECITTIKTALQMGYRSFDTAQFYGNEAWLTEAIRQSNVPREDIFITTKISNTNQTEDRVTQSYADSLGEMQEQYVDLLLIHFPMTDTRAKTWAELEEIYAKKQARAIGVSNYTVRHLEELLKTCKVKPAVNQVELHVFLQQPELVAFCKQNDILIEAYSPLAHGQGFDDPVLVSVGKKHNASPAQIMLAWCRAMGAVPLPKTTNPDHLRADLDALKITLDQEDLVQLGSLNKGFRTAWDPTNTP